MIEYNLTLSIQSVKKGEAHNCILQCCTTDFLIFLLQNMLFRKCLFLFFFIKLHLRITEVIPQPVERHEARFLHIV